LTTAWRAVILAKAAGCRRRVTLFLSLVQGVHKRMQLFRSSWKVTRADGVRGCVYREVFGWDVYHWFHPRAVQVSFVPRGGVESVLDLFLPRDEFGKIDSAEWRLTMSENWLSRAASAKAAVAGSDHVVEDAEFAGKFPALFAFMSSSLGVEGLPREVCKVQVFADRGEWRAALHDGNTEHSLFVTLKKPQDAFTALEKALTAAVPDWRAWKGSVAKKGKKG